MQPRDIMYGDDFYDPDLRHQVLEEIQSQRPRLAVIEFPCGLWSNLTKLSYRSQERRRLLKKLRDQQRPFLDFTKQVF